MTQVRNIKWGETMPSRIRGFHISASAEAHIQEKHGLCLDEVLEAADSSGTYAPAAPEPALSLNPTGHKRYLIADKTESGRRLWVIFADEGGEWGRIITAREALGNRERHRRTRGD